MTTEERTRYVCRRLTERVGEVAPPGLGKWDRAWELVADPSTAFLDALTAWEGEDAPRSRARLQAAADAVVRAWRLAGEEWEARGRPGADAREEVTA